MEKRVEKRFEIGVAVAITIVAVILHVAFFTSAGPLWRDEINSVRLAASPTFRAFAHDMQFDSFPALWFAVLRAWPGDPRLLGLVTGLGILAAAWYVGAGRAPAIALALIGTSGAIVRYGDSVRAYGFAILLAILSLATLYRTVVLRRGYALATLFAVLSVHTTYYNPVVLLACCAGAAAAHALERRWRDVVQTIGVGAIAAISLLVYIPTIRNVSRWSSLAKYEIDALWIWRKFADALGMSGSLGTRVWLALLFIGLAVAVLALVRRDARTPRLVFCGVTLLVLTLGYYAFISVLAYLMQPWYFILFLAIAALCIDGLLTIVPTLGRALVALAIAAICFVPARAAVTQRATTMDRVAAPLARHASPRDLVIVYPWYFGVSFSHYYRGSAPWTTMPAIDDHRLHRYDLAKRAAEAPSTEVAMRAQQVLANGGRVWLVGLPLYEESAAYLQKPQVATGIAKADLVWSHSLERVLRQARAGMVVRPDPHAVEYERAALLVFTPR